MDGFDRKGLPDYLVGSELIQVCIGNNEIILNFMNDVSITVFSVDVFVKDNREFFDSIIDIGNRSRHFGATIQKCCVVDRDLAYVIFSDGLKLLFKNDSPNLESLTITDGNAVTVV